MGAAPIRSKAKRAVVKKPSACGRRKVERGIAQMPSSMALLTRIRPASATSFIVKLTTGDNAHKSPRKWEQLMVLGHGDRRGISYKRNPSPRRTPIEGSETGFEGELDMGARFNLTNLCSRLINSPSAQCDNAICD